MKKRKRIRYVAAAALLILSAETARTETRADVITTEDAYSQTGAVYVAGNPDFYPVEYYNQQEKTYEGILTEILGMVSEETGIDFVYLNGGIQDQREQMAQNGQAELISGCTDSEIEQYGLEPSETILSYEQDGMEYQICFGFSEIASEELKKAVNESLSFVTEDHTAGIVLGYVRERAQKNYPLWLLIMVCFLAAAVLIGLLVLFARFRRYRKIMYRNSIVDPVTEIGNKDYFFQCFDQEQAEGARAIYAIAYIGFDIVKVNHYYGEEEAESQLRFAAEELTRNAPDTDIIARVSGGGFAVAHASANEQQICLWIEELLNRLNRYCEKFGKDYCPYFAAGIYMMENDDRDCRKVLQNAQQGYEYAQSNNLPYMFSNRVWLKEQKEKKVLTQSLVKALEDHEFRLFLQCTVRADTGTICGAEALSRWDHPQKGLLRPGSYIELLEQEGKISELDFYIFEESCKQLESWERAGIQLYISCNFARTTIDQENFVQRVREISDKHEFVRSNLVMEITEDTLEQNKKAAFQNINECKKMGFSIALDDLGSGYTSFSDLRDYPIDIVKIDRSILNSAATEKGAALLEGMVALAHSLNIRVLCEGVETGQQYEMLKRMGCQYIQGFYFYRAVPCEEAYRYICQSTGTQDALLLARK